MPDEPTPPAVDVEGDDDGDHTVPADLVEIHEAIDYLDRVGLQPNETP